VTPGEILAEIETDKATMEWESTETESCRDLRRGRRKGKRGRAHRLYRRSGGRGSGRDRDRKAGSGPRRKNLRLRRRSRIYPEKKPPTKNSRTEPAEKSDLGRRIKVSSARAQDPRPEKGIDLTESEGQWPGRPDRRERRQRLREQERGQTVPAVFIGRGLVRNNLTQCAR
jgi:pyruvate/2-oxoglutarate dehydrogenase complex dihydrolipoamide acyltransferase (E2) component